MVVKLAYQPEAEPNIIAAGEFKAKCLRLMDQALASQQPLTVTKRGRVIGQFVPKPVEQKLFRSIVGRSPAIRIPTHGEWKKLKAEWTADSELSLKSTARTVETGLKKKSRKA